MEAVEAPEEADVWEAQNRKTARRQDSNGMADEVPPAEDASEAAEAAREAAAEEARKAAEDLKTAEAWKEEAALKAEEAMEAWKARGAAGTASELGGEELEAGGRGGAVRRPYHWQGG